MYYLYSKNKGADQLRSYREADLRLCFRICKKADFLMTRLILILAFVQGLFIRGKSRSKWRRASVLVQVRFSNDLHDVLVKKKMPQKNI